MPSVSDRLAIGQRLELQVDNDWFPSRLEGTDAAGHVLTVAWPTDRERCLVPLKADDTLELAGSMQDALYSAAVRVVRTIGEGVPLVVVQVSGSWQRSQRRNAVRLPVAIRPRSALRLKGDDQEEPLRVGITNISAGGLQLRSADRVSVGDQVELAFELLGVREELTILARVCRVEEAERVWIAGCQFERISDRIVQQIVQFIFAQQRAEIIRLRKAG